MKFVAVICLNDYPDSVTQSFDTREEADAAGLAEKQRLQATPVPQEYLMHPRYYHFHVLEQIDRRSGKDRRVNDGLTLPEGLVIGRRRASRRDA